MRASLCATLCWGLALVFLGALMVHPLTPIVVVGAVVVAVAVGWVRDRWLLASLGADVIKVESPQGDSARSTPPFEDGISLYFASLNRNKRSMRLDLKTAAGKEGLGRLLASADVFIEIMRPGVRERLGCGDTDLARINPRLVRASISGSGDRPAQQRNLARTRLLRDRDRRPGGPTARLDVIEDQRRRQKHRHPRRLFPPRSRTSLRCRRCSHTRPS